MDRKANPPKKIHRWFLTAVDFLFVD